MIEVQCTSCHTRYRIDEQVLPEGTPTFKCSRCGHVFSVDPRAVTSRRAAFTKPQSPATPGPSPSSPTQPEHKPPAPPLRASESADEAEVDPIVDAPGSAPKETAPPTHSVDSTASSRPSPSPADVTRTAVAAKDRPAETPLRDSAVVAEADLLSRSFDSRPADPEPGENLSFDFTDEEAPSPEGEEHDLLRAPDPETESARWEVGEDPGNDSIAIERSRNPILTSAEPAAARTRKRRPRPVRPMDDEEDFIDERRAPVYNKRIVHSARFFLMIFFLIAIGFGATSLIMHQNPALAEGILNQLPVIGGRFASPTAPARLVALREVVATYQHAKDGATALVISGSAENVGNVPLHVVQIAVALRDSTRRALAAHAVYCGNNNLAPKMVSSMTPHEIEFFQKLDPPKNFTLGPSATTPFVVVFINPPPAAARFDVAVQQATPAATADLASAPSS